MQRPNRVGAFDLEFSRSNSISGMGGLIVMERKGQESTGCPDVKSQGNESSRCQCSDSAEFSGSSAQ